MGLNFDLIDLLDSDPSNTSKRKLRVAVGVTVLLCVLVAVATLHLRRQQAHQDLRKLAFQALAAEDWTAAENLFQRGVGGLDRDPLAVIGLATVHGIQTASVPSRISPAQPPSHLDLTTATLHTQRLLIASQPRQAAVYVQAAIGQLGNQKTLHHLHQFAQSWVYELARKDRK